MDSTELWELGQVVPRLVAEKASALAMKRVQDPAKMEQAALLGRLAGHLYLVSFDDGESNEDGITKFLDKLELLCRVSYNTSPSHSPPFLCPFPATPCLHPCDILIYASSLTGDPHGIGPRRGAKTQRRECRRKIPHPLRFEVGTTSDRHDQEIRDLPQDLCVPEGG